MCVDLSLDPIAVEVGYWRYDVKDPNSWFGVPFGNYLGWFGMVFWFSLSIRFAARRLRIETRPAWVQVLIPVVGAAAAVVPFGGSMWIYSKTISNTLAEPYIFFDFLLVVLVVLALILPVVPRTARIDPASIVAPMFFLIFQNAVLFLAPLLNAGHPVQTEPSLVILTQILTAFVLLLYVWPALDTIEARFRRTVVATDESTLTSGAGDAGTTAIDG
jgi:hypothetical protein